MFFQDKETPQFFMLLLGFHILSYSDVLLKTRQIKQDLISKDGRRNLIEAF